MCVLNNILHLIEKNNVKQKDLTDYLGISKNAFTNWKGGFSRSYMKHLPKIAEFFGVSVDFLLGREEIKKEPDFTYALYNETKLTQEQKDSIQLLYENFVKANEHDN